MQLLLILRTATSRGAASIRLNTVFNNNMIMLMILVDSHGNS